MTPDRAPNCLHCIHFHITHDPAFPYACDEFEVQGKRMPAQEVFIATGRHCPVFVLNPKVKAASQGAPALDKDGWLA